MGYGVVICVGGFFIDYFISEVFKGIFVNRLGSYDVLKKNIFCIKLFKEFNKIDFDF